jgi:hypothetical protein
MLPDGILDRKDSHLICQTAKEYFKEAQTKIKIKIKRESIILIIFCSFLTKQL